MISCLFACLYLFSLVCLHEHMDVQHMHAVPSEAIKGCQIPWDSEWQRVVSFHVGAWELNSGPLQDQLVSALNCRAIQALCFLFLRIRSLLGVVWMSHRLVWMAIAWFVWMLNHKLVELFGKEQVVCSCGRRCALVGGGESLLEDLCPCWRGECPCWRGFVLVGRGV